MKTLGPAGICPYIESLINMCIPSLRVNSSSSLSPPLVLISLFLALSSSPVTFPPSPSRSLVPYPLFIAPLSLKQGVLARCVRWEALGEPGGGVCGASTALQTNHLLPAEVSGC